PDLVDPDSDYYVERIARAVRHDEHLERQNGGLTPSRDMSGDGISNDKAEDMTRDGMPTWYEKEYGVNNPAGRGWQHPYLHNERYAVLVASGDKDEDRNYPGFWNDIHYLYKVLVDDYNYIEDNVYLLYSEWNGVDHSDGCEYIDDEASWDGVERTLENISKRITTNDFLTIAMSGHGSSDGYFHFADEDSVDSDAKEYDEFNPYLDNMSYNRMAVMISACYSGTAIQPLSGINRIIMTSAAEDETSYMTLGTSESSAFFYEGRRHRMLGLIVDVYEGMFRNLGSQEAPRYLYYAFLRGKWAAENNKSLRTDASSNPQITNVWTADWTYL
ncbi:MAG: C13 family peptidase, partial [Thermoplasmatota archaeon]